MKFYFEFLFLLQLFSSLSCENWSYKEQNKWPGICSTGMRQSPIPIRHFDTVKKEYKTITINSNFLKLQQAEIINSGNSLDLKFTNSSIAPKISDGDFPRSEYTFHILNFRWGSEHIIDNIKYPVEAQLVFYASDYKSFENAKKFKDGIVIYAVLFTISDKPNPQLDNIIAQIPAIAHSHNKSVKLKQPIKLFDFLPDLQATYYRYRGSFTTPNCNEVVTWIVFPYPLYLTETQLVQLYNVYDSEDTISDRHYRDLQRINGRHPRFHEGVNAMQLDSMRYRKL